MSDRAEIGRAKHSPMTGTNPMRLGMREVTVRSRVCPGASMFFAVLAALGIFAPATGQPIPTRQKAPESPSLETLVKDVLVKADQSGDLSTACSSLELLCDRIAAHVLGPTIDEIAFADTPRRVLEDIKKAPDARALFLCYQAHPKALESLAYLLRIEQSNRLPSYQALQKLIAVRAEKVNEFPDLAAAVAAVHETQFTRKINENTAKGSSAVEVFDFFIEHTSGMVLDPSSTPAEVLVYVVDSAATVNDLAWAREEYKDRKPDLGRCYFQIDYDYDHFLKGTPKKVTASGRFTLSSIHKHGGVCADQAHYAAHVGKAFGVPTAYVRGRGVDVSHAWIGQFEVAGRKSEWNFSAGRYDGYQNLRGDMPCPVTKQWVTDGEVALIAEFAKYTLSERRTAAALVDVARRWASAPPKEALEPIPGMRQTTRVPRGSDMEGRLAVLRVAAETCPHDPGTWRAVAQEAKRGGMTKPQLKDWSNAMLRLTGTKYPDFSYEVLADMIATVADPAEQSSMWDWACNTFSRRPDLASAARLRQAAMWEKTGDPGRAWIAYDNIATRFANDSPDTVRAVEKMLRLLSKNERRKENAVPMLERVWKRIQPPTKMASQFSTQSNWFRVGKMLSDEYDSNGDKNRAETVRKRLGL